MGEWKVSVACIPLYVLLKVKVRAERFKVTLALVSDCNINQLFFAGEWVMIAVSFC